MKNKSLVRIKKYLPYIILGFILFVGAFLRLYRIREYMVFLGDEGRDMLVVKRMLIDHKFTLLGPITSVGSMYMGPIYYYLMAPFLWVWRFDPVGPSVMVALFSIVTILLIYLFGNEFFNKKVGLLAAFFYSISPLTIIYGRASWNPNIVPFFSLLLMYSLCKVIVSKKYKWIFMVGFSLGFVLQLHYVTILFIPVIFFCLALERFAIPFQYYLRLVIGWAISYSPFLLFEIRHQFVNLRAVWRFLLTGNSKPISAYLAGIVHTVNDVSVRLFWRLIVIENAEFTKLFVIILIFFIIYYWRVMKKDKLRSRTLKIVLIWLGIGILSFGLYQGAIYDYYFGSLFPIPFILTGMLLDKVWSLSLFRKTLFLSIFGCLVFFNLKNSPLKNTPNNLLRISESIARFVYDKTEGKPYNFALIADKNSDHAYRYFLELWGRPPVPIEPPAIDPERKTVTSQLLVVCEEKICKPLGHPLWEIAGFGRAEIEDQWQVETARVFRLIRYKEI